MIVKKPGVDDGSYIVAGHTNQIYRVTPRILESLHLENEDPLNVKRIV